MSSTRKRILETTSASLHIMAMLFMLCDHLWGTVIPGNDWMTVIGRLTFPIYAFMIVEGYFHTKNLKKYVLRLLIFALFSEIPFNLVMGSRVFYPIHQNVLFTFLIAIALVHWNEKVKERKLWLRLLVAMASILLGYLGGIVTFVDFYYAGVLTVLVFYFFRQRKWWSYAAQLVLLAYINLEMIGGFGYNVELFGQSLFIVRQAFALLALIPIWLYRGRQGYHSKWLQYTYYAFYPAHLLALYLIKVVFLP